MRILSSYKSGVTEALSNRKMIFLLWFVNAFVSFLIFVPSFILLSRNFGSNILGEKMLKATDYALWLEFYVQNQKGANPVLLSGVLVVFIFTFLSIFLSGGILGVLTRKEQNEKFSSSFFKNSGYYFGKFFRLTLFSLIFWVGLGIFYFILRVVGSKITKNGEKELLAFILGISFLGIVLLIGLFFKVVFNYAKIIIVKEESKKAVKSCLKALSFSLKNIWRSYLLYLILSITGVVLFVIFFLLLKISPITNWISIVYLIIIQQVFIWSREALKITILSSQRHFLGS